MFFSIIIKRCNIPTSNKSTKKIEKTPTARIIQPSSKTKRNKWTRIKIRNNMSQLTTLIRKAQDLAMDVFGETIVDTGWVRLFVKYEQCCQIVTHGPKQSWNIFYPCATKKIGQRSRQISCYRHMDLRGNRLIWVCQYWNLQLLLMASISLQKRATFWKGNQQSFWEPIKSSRG